MIEFEKLSFEDWDNLYSSFYWFTINFDFIDVVDCNSINSFKSNERAIDNC